MRRTPSPHPDGHALPPLGLAQHNIVLRQQALWRAFGALQDQAMMALAIGDTAKLKRLADPLLALAEDISEVQAKMFKAWGIDDIDHVTWEINAPQQRTPQATAERAAAIQDLLEHSADVAQRADKVGLTEIASRVRGLANHYRDLANPELPPLPDLTEKPDTTAISLIPQTFAAVKLAAQLVLCNAHVEVAEARADRDAQRRNDGDGNLQNEPDARSADLIQHDGKQARQQSTLPGSHGRAPSVPSDADHRAEPAPPPKANRKDPPAGPTDFQSLYRSVFQREDQEWTPPTRPRSWTEPRVEPPPLMDNRFTSAGLGSQWPPRRRPR